MRQAVAVEEPGFDLRIYYCAGCGSNDRRAIIEFTWR
jgi:hypothetical protein